MTNRSRAAGSARLLTVQEAAQRLCLRDRTIRKWIRLRRVGYVKLGKAVRIPETAVEELLREGNVPRRGSNTPFDTMIH